MLWLWTTVAVKQVRASALWVGRWKVGIGCPCHTLRFEQFHQKQSFFQYPQRTLQQCSDGLIKRASEVLY
jgi:hypothetical protein